MQWTRVEPLAARHDLDAFRCGRPSVDDWVRRKARSSAHTVATHVCVDDGGAVLGFFALTTVIIDSGALTSAVRRGGRGEMTGVLLAQMGLHESLQGGGRGADLFRRAVQEAALCSQVCRLPLLVVDAADEGLVGFYERLGMRRLANTFRLVARLDKIAPHRVGET